MGALESLHKEDNMRIFTQEWFQDTGLKNQSLQSRIESDIDMISVLNHERQLLFPKNLIKKYCRKSLGF